MIDIMNELKEYDVVPMVYDPVADKAEALHEYGIEFASLEDIRDVDCLIIAVGHEEFMKMSLSDFDKFFKDVPNNKKVLVDIKGVLDRREAERLDYNYWRL